MENGLDVAIKTFSLCKDSVAAAQAEACMYRDLQSLQGLVIPTLIGTGRLPLLGTGFLAISFVEGQPLSNLVCKVNTRDYYESVAVAIRQAFQLIHNLGVAQGDVRLANILLVDGCEVIEQRSSSSMSSSSLGDHSGSVQAQLTSHSSQDPLGSHHPRLLSQISPGEIEGSRSPVGGSKAPRVMIVDFERAFHAGEETLNSEMVQLDSMLQAWLGK